MKSRPRIFSAIILTPPSTGVTSSAASSAPRRTPLRRIVEARTASANIAPTQGTIRVSLVMRTKRSNVCARGQVGLLVRRGALRRGNTDQLGVRSDVSSDHRLGLRHGISVPGAEDCVGFDEIFLVRGGCVGTVVNRRHGARGNTGAAIDALFGMNEEHGRRLELGFILARVNAVNGAHIHTRTVLGADAGVGDDESHCA